MELEHIRAQRQPSLQLFGWSFLMLFLELALIRWLGSNILYLSYFSNLILLGSFLGIGIGFLIADRDYDLPRWLPKSLLLLVGFVLVFPVEINRFAEDLIFFGDVKPSGLPLWLTVPVIFIAVVFIMTAIGQGVARRFAQLAPLNAYRVDIAGSLAGVVAFAGLSYFRASPVVWGAVVAALMIWLIQDRSGSDVVALAGLVIVLGAQSLSPGLSWSSYYQVASVTTEDSVFVGVNGILHQEIASVEELEGTLYAQPYPLHGPETPERVLIVGAGTGNDVAIALDRGARSVDAVEIDARLYELGTELHPDDPYADPRVRVTIDDGRAFMQRTSAQFDLIIFALPDSLTLVSGQASLRLESFLFTAEALERAAALLAPGGTFTMYNYYRENWLIDRLANTVRLAFDRDPCVLSAGDVGRRALIAVGEGPSANCPAPVRSLGMAPTPATDDHPFPYLRERGIPGIYGITLSLLLVISLLLVRQVVGGFGKLRPYLDLLAMGVAFLLLETKSVVQYALWFGTTWIVNALVFIGVLISVLAAIEVARRFRLPRPSRLYSALFAALLVAFLVPTHALLEVAAPLRLLLGTILTFAPIFIANLIFAQRFAQTASSTAAFGANLLGAMLGGILEYSSLIIGYRALILLVALVYASAFLLGRRHLVTAN
jgi:spermidine synthase